MQILHKLMYMAVVEQGTSSDLNVFVKALCTCS